ncbi:hypothetical protein MCHIJ_03430 [Mycolicibacterium chitae]|uniref:Methyltransferase type 12 n=1 Tax=Mycolicibacterium chitae TaxID=1792 RepID=A0A3S4RJN1_MYCCI|nr:hypothetical protein MCHIJ_03430 [Mycolicibacterium chitae]VEG49753.1 methyltransferase type 12 [Mycolicibacterium chitae]
MEIGGSACRACGSAGLQPVLAHDGLTLVLCPDCGLAQLPTRADEADAAVGPPCRPRGPTRAEDVTQAVRTADAADLLRGETVRHFGGAHGGSWLPLLTAMGMRTVYGGPADVVVDSFGAMHDRGQRAAIAQLAAATAPAGVLLMQFDPVAENLRRGEWDMLSRNHFAYYSLTSLSRLLAAEQMSVVAAWKLDLHGGTTMLAAVHASQWPVDAEVSRMLTEEHQLGVASGDGFEDLRRRSGRDR